MATSFGRPARRTTARCPHCLSQKSLLRASADLPLYLRLLGGHTWCDACLRHYFQLRFFGLLVPITEPKGWKTV